MAARAPPWSPSPSWRAPPPWPPPPAPCAGSAAARAAAASPARAACGAGGRARRRAGGRVCGREGAQPAQAHRRLKGSLQRSAGSNPLRAGALAARQQGVECGCRRCRRNPAAHLPRPTPPTRHAQALCCPMPDNARGPWRAHLRPCFFRHSFWALSITEPGSTCQAGGGRAGRAHAAQRSVGTARSACFHAPGNVRRGRPHTVIRGSSRLRRQLPPPKRSKRPWERPPEYMKYQKEARLPSWRRSRPYAAPHAAPSR